MHKSGLLLFLLLFVVIIYSLLRWYPDYALHFDGKAYQVGDLPVSIQKIAPLYDFLLKEMCKSEDCSFHYVKSDFNGANENKFYKDKPKDLLQKKYQVAKSQYLFSLLKEKPLIVNQTLDKSLQSIEGLPWLGSRRDLWWIKIRHGLSGKARLDLAAIIKRLVRDYPGLRIYLDLQVLKEGNAAYIKCLQDKKKFWQQYFMKSFVKTSLCKRGPTSYVTDVGLVISDQRGESLVYTGYDSIVKAVQATYILSKFKQ